MYWEYCKIYKYQPSYILSIHQGFFFSNTSALQIENYCACAVTVNCNWVLSKMIIQHTFGINGRKTFNNYLL